MIKTLGLIGRDKGPQAGIQGWMAVPKTIHSLYEGEHKGRCVLKVPTQWMPTGKVSYVSACTGQPGASLR